MAYSEHGQDMWLNENIFKNRTEGVFVECGAIDGLITSNSLFFELNLGWTGLCIEPNPDMFAKLKVNRKCNCENSAISGKLETVHFANYPAVVGWSGILEYMGERNIQRIQDHNQGDTIITEIQALPMEIILRKYGLHKKTIDYLSLDVEGCEANIIKSLDFDEFNIGILDIEDNYGDLNLDDYLKERGYNMIKKLDINRIYKRVDYV